MKTSVVLLVMVSACSAGAATIDTGEFFAYRKISPSNRFETGMFILLSHRPCRDHKAREYGWKAAAYLFPQTVGKMNACWVASKDDDFLKVCLTSEEGAVGNACQWSPKSMFNTTASLPRQANF